MTDTQQITTSANTPAVAEQSMSERFTAMVMKEYKAICGSDYVFTGTEKQLIRNYFIVTDQALAKAEADRIRKNENNRDHKYDNPLPYTWQNVNLPVLAKDLAHFARVGLDMMEDNHLFPIPYKDNKNNVYGMTLMEGYNGIRYQATKYALTEWKSVTVEVVFENDVFKPLKKDSRCNVEGYEFDVPQPFNRGKPIGVFGYIEYDNAAKNKLVVFSAADVEKRKPKYAAAEFWGGVKTVYDNGKKVEVVVDGWLPEMYEKTMKREIYGSKHIPRDPKKIDESYMYIQMREQQYAELTAQAEIAQNANRDPVMLPPPNVPAPDAMPVKESSGGHKHVPPVNLGFDPRDDTPAPYATPAAAKPDGDGEPHIDDEQDDDEPDFMK